MHSLLSQMNVEANEHKQHHFCGPRGADPTPVVCITSSGLGQGDCGPVEVTHSPPTWYIPHTAPLQLTPAEVTTDSHQRCRCHQRGSEVRTFII